MPRPSLGPRIWFDGLRETWIIRDGSTFIRAGADRDDAEKRLAEYLGGPRVVPMRQPVTGFVYFISAAQPDFPVKIGFAEKSHKLRLKGLQTGCPYPLITLATVPGTYKDESALHRRFRDDRLCGEWFRRSDHLMSIISNISQSSAA